MGTADLTALVNLDSYERGIELGGYVRRDDLLEVKVGPCSFYGFDTKAEAAQDVSNCHGCDLVYVQDEKGKWYAITVWLDGKLRQR